MSNEVKVNEAAAQPRWVRKKNRKKFIRTIIQCGLFLLAAVILFRVHYSISDYLPFTANSEVAVQTAPAEGTAFIAISYFGVEKYDSGSTTLIAQERLAEHIKALTDSGYVTITQQDIIDYYNGEKELPVKALFLMFEDGRRDTAIFAQKILEKNNYIATALTYADKFEKKDTKFLSVNDLHTLKNSSYWEWGSNGYRLEYINVFDRYGNYYGHLNSNEFVSVNQYIVRDYNHYLMDFLRDEDRLRTESLAEMQARILADYDSMDYIYKEKLGEVPRLYTLMHSNTGMFGTDPLVSKENELNMTRMFALNFNREGSCANSRESSVYDLSRLQPQANWYSNHLLMRITDDTGQEVSFVTGDEQEAANWTTMQGAAEFRDDAIVLTSEPNSYGRLLLSDYDNADLSLSVTLDGNVAGNQGLYLRADEELHNALYVGIENNVLVMRQISGGVTQDIYSLDLFEFDGGAQKSVEEDEQEGLTALQQALIKYDTNYERLQQAKSELKQLQQTAVTTLAEGGEGYVPAIDLLDIGSRALDITLSGNNITVAVDGRTAIRNLKINAAESGQVVLEASALIQEKYSQRNLADDVYDAVFTDLTINNAAGEEDYAYTLRGWEKLVYEFKTLFENVVMFFKDTF